MLRSCNTAKQPETVFALQRVSASSGQNLGKYQDRGLHALERLRQSQPPAESVEFGADAGLMSTK